MTSLSRVYLNTKHLRSNITSFKKLLKPKTKLVAVIKANAYGHGQNIIAKIVEPLVDYFQVDDLLELKLLREVSQKDALVLGYVAEDEIKETLSLNGILALYDYKRLATINTIADALGRPARVHIKIDAGLGRQGIITSELRDFLHRIKKYTHIKVEGFYSHFSDIEDTANLSYAKTQISLLENAIKIAKEEGFENVHTHIEATSGIMAFCNNCGHNMVRLGIGMYGLYPSENLKRQWHKKLKLKPVLSWQTKVAQIKLVPKNFSIGYGRTFITKKETKIAIIPQGYSDGFDRGLSNIGSVLINGSKAKVLGRVAMNMFAVDVSHIKNIKQEDTVVIIGTSKKQEITAEDIARLIGTINYEVVTRISPLLPRIVI